jgi:hypothetical protein
MFILVSCCGGGVMPLFPSGTVAVANGLSFCYFYDPFGRGVLLFLPLYVSIEFGLSHLFLESLDLVSQAVFTLAPCHPVGLPSQLLEI